MRLKKRIQKWLGIDVINVKLLDIPKDRELKTMIAKCFDAAIDDNTLDWNDYFTCYLTTRKRVSQIIESSIERIEGDKLNDIALETINSEEFLDKFVERVLRKQIK